MGYFGKYFLSYFSSARDRFSRDEADYVDEIQFILDETIDILEFI
jgi:hypothetical protein